MSVPLADVARVIRSKNSGPFELSLDVIFKDPATYRAAKAGALFSPGLIARLYRVDESKVLAIKYFDAACAVKIVLERALPSGDLGERDVYGAQQHAPLLQVEVPR